MIARALQGMPRIACLRPARLPAVLAILAALAPAVVVAQTVERPDVRPGDEWRFAVSYTTEPSSTPNRTWSITAVTADAIKATEDGEPLRLTRDLNVLESPRDRSSDSRLLAFPLQVGKRWTYVNDWEFKPKRSRGRAAGEVVVVAWEKVSVPAGEFEAFKLVAKESLSGTSPIGSTYAGEATRTYWYAPAARAIVKAEHRNPYLGPTTVVLSAFRLR